MDKILVTDELIISLIKEKNYEDAWGYCKYMGYPIVKDGIIRESLFMRFAKHFDYENFDCWNRKDCRGSHANVA